MVSNGWLTSCPSCGQRSDKGCIPECPDLYFSTDLSAHRLASSMAMKVHFSSGKDDWETPDDLFSLYNGNFHFVLDAAANADNHKCDRWYGPAGVERDALAVDWPLNEGNIWLNPPYSRPLQAQFVEKAYKEHRRFLDSTQTGHPCGAVVCLLPARTDTKLFHDLIQPFADVEFLRGRIKFKGGSSCAPFPSMICVF